MRIAILGATSQIARDLTSLQMRESDIDVIFYYAISWE